MNIGDEVWFAVWDTASDYVTCPDCGGTGQITAILFDGTRLSIECEGCKRGFDPATGKIKVYKRQPQARYVCVTGMELYDGVLVYNTDGGWHVSADDLFTDRDAALARAARKCAEADAEERARIAQKEKPAKSWSWHVHYHRRRIREAEKEIAYHTERLAVARVKTKDGES